MFEDTKGVISSRISKDKQYKAKRANSDLQNITHTNKKNHNPIEFMMSSFNNMNLN
jgi:hypothetical protein